MIYGIVFAITVYVVYTYLSRALAGYSYEYTKRKGYVNFKYSLEVYYQGKSIHHDEYQSSTLFGWFKMAAQALSHRRRMKLGIE